MLDDNTPALIEPDADEGEQPSGAYRSDTDQPDIPVLYVPAVDPVEPAGAGPDEPPDGDDAAPAPQPQVEPAELELPTRMLHAVGCAQGEPGRYATDCLLVETPAGSDLLCVAATDGRRLVVAHWRVRLFDGRGRVLVPGHIAANAAKLAKARAIDAEPMAVVRRDAKGDCVLTVHGTEGTVMFTWREPETAFAPYQDVIPTWGDGPAVGLLGISPDLLASTLKTVMKVAGSEHAVRLYLPTQADRPIGVEVRLAPEDVQVLAVVMPARIAAWDDQPVAADPADPDPDQMQIDDPPAGDPNAWKAEPASTLGLPDTLLAKLAAAEPPMATVGDVAAWAERKYEPKVPGVGPGKRQLIDDALVAFHMRRANRPAETTEAAGPDGTTAIVRRGRQAVEQGDESGMDPTPDAAPADPFVAARNRDSYDGVLLVDVLAAAGVSPFYSDSIRQTVIGATDTATLGQLEDALADGEVFPDARPKALAKLFDAVRAWFARLPTTEE